MKKFALIVRAGSATGGKYYNDYRNGDILLFNDEIKAENFARKIEERSSKTVWVEVAEYDPNKKLEKLLNNDFTETIGRKMKRI